MILFKTDITKGLDIVSSQFGISNKNCGILFTHIRLIEFSKKKKNKGAEAPLTLLNDVWSPIIWTKTQNRSRFHV